MSESDRPEKSPLRARVRRTTWVVDKKLQYGLIIPIGALSLVVILAYFGFANYISTALDRCVLLTGTEDRAEFGALVRDIIESYRVAVAVIFIVYSFLFAFVTLQLTNRIAGPVYHIRRKMMLGRKSGKFEKVHLRKGDFQKELADEYNLLIDHIEALSKPGSAEEK